MTGLRYAPILIKFALTIFQFLLAHLHIVAVGARFELAVQLPVRQFSKLLV